MVSWKRFGVLVLLYFVLLSDFQYAGIKAAKTTAQLVVYSMPPTVHNELTGKNIPAGITPVNKLSVRMCRGEFEPLSLLIQPQTAVNNITFAWTDFSASQGSFSKKEMDAAIVKVWYQSGYKSDQTNNKHLTQEILVKNDNLIKVDYTTQTNYLLVYKNGTSFYQNISDPAVSFPNDVIVKDSISLQPFSLDGSTNRQIWLTVHVPPGTPEGKYTSQFTISCDQGNLMSFPIEVEVLPFDLDSSRLTYSIYYNGYADKYTLVPFSYTTKSPEQYKIEMEDLRDHGVLYPTTYQILKNLDLDLQIRRDAGLPNDKLYTLGLITGNPSSQTELDNLKAQVKQWEDKIAQYGYKTLYVYGIDEARGTQLTSQRPAWQAVHEAGANVFVAGYYDTYDYMGDLLDLGIIQDALRTDQAQKYHSKNHLIFSYSNPQVGQENPEIYRRNFGLALWKAGYDGAMNYAYQKFYKSEWNDFDNTAYREETFTYETSNGILRTIEWEGFREGVDDVRYLSTLLNKIDQMKKAGQNTASLEDWVNSLDPNGDLDITRSQIIDKILSVNTVMPVELSAFTGKFAKGMVSLCWQTATEFNNYGFEVERVSDGKTNKREDWKKIGFVQGHGNSSSPKEYLFMDNNAPVGQIKYRLKQIDNDGSYKYYEPVIVNCTAPGEFKLMQNSPNPFNPTTTISYSIPNLSYVELKVYDMLGREAATLINKEQNPGEYKVQFDATSLPSGIYVYTIHAGDYRASRKLMLLK